MPDAEVRHWTAVRDAATACVSIASTVVAAYQGGHVDVTSTWYHAVMATDWPYRGRVPEILRFPL